MDLSLLSRHSEFEWQILPTGKMRVPGVLYATEHLIRDMDLKVHEQVSNVATLPGIVRASYAMPDAHWGYGFPIGGVAAFDPEQGGVVSAGGVGFDISCGVRTLHTGLTLEQVRPHREALADALYRAVPAGLGSTERLHLGPEEMEAISAAGPGGRSGADTARRPTWSESRSTAAWRGPSPARSPSRPSGGNATRWGRSARATTISRCSTSPRSSTPRPPVPSGSAPVISW